MSSTNRGGDRVEADFYATPRWCVDLIVPHLPPLAGKRILEPSAGRGSIVAALLAHGAEPHEMMAVEKDIGRAEHIPSIGMALCGGDFLAAVRVPRFDLIVMNPPFAEAEEHVRHAISLLAPGGTCAALLRLPFVMCGKGRRAFRKAHPCDVYPLDKRPSFTAEVLTWASDAELLAMAQTKGGKTETVDEVRSRLRATDSCDYAWALYGEGRGGRYHVLEAS